MDLPKITIEQTKLLLFSARLDNLPQACLTDYCLACLGYDPALLSNQEILQKIDEVDAIFEALSTPIDFKYQQGDYFLAQKITAQPFVKYFLFEKLLKNKTKSFIFTQTQDILLLCAIFLDKRTDKADVFDLPEREKRAFILENELGGVDIYRYYQQIISQINELPDIYPHYYTHGAQRYSPEVQFYIDNALELQMQYIASINHCKISDVYLFSIDEVFTYISIANQKSVIENAKISRNI